MAGGNKIRQYRCWLGHYEHRDGDRGRDRVPAGSGWPDGAVGFPALLYRWLPGDVPVPEAVYQYPRRITGV